MNDRRRSLVLGIVGVWIGGCMSGDPAPRMIANMDQAPAEKRPPNWEKTRSLMLRTAPQIGDPAPDFTLKTKDGRSSVTRSTFQAGRPQVLIFGSFT